MPKKLTKEEFINREPDLLNGEYEMLGNYYGSPVKTLFKHTSCGYKWMLTPADFHRDVRCPKCVVRKPTFTKEAFVEREEDIQSGEYTMLGDYTTARKKTLFKHNICGCEWMVVPYSFHRGIRCPRCAGVERLTKDEFCEREEDIQSGEYMMLGKYVNISTKTLFRHNKCGYEWKCKPAHFKDGHRCPRCKQSRGESCISDLLSNLNIPFESQKIFNTCRHKRPLPFDFYVNDSFLVEYDGEQHFRPVDHFGGDEGFEIRQLRDNIKTKWAKDNGIPLVRIPYAEFDNIEQIIKENIEKYSVQKAG